MRIGVLCAPQHSMFSSGVAQGSLAVAETLRALGSATVDLIGIGSGAANSWWDDCQSIQPAWSITPLKDASGYDLVVEIGRLQLTAADRKRVARQAVWVVRQPFLLHEIESSIFATTSTPKRELEGLTEIWVMDAAVTDPGDLQALELLARCPVRQVPYVWTSSIAASHMADCGVTDGNGWLAATLEELKRKCAGVEAGASPPPLPPWNVHVAETNTTNGSSAVLPLVILREARRRGLPVSRFTAHNADSLTASGFFRDNTLRHCVDGAVGLSGEFIGRQRCVEWARQPMSCVLSHIRFARLRPMLLDLAWAGVPVVHNSVALRDIGSGLERLYYADNHVSEACDAVRRMTEDLVTLQGIFATDALGAIRAGLLERFGPGSAGVAAGWRAALEGMAAAPLRAEVAPSVQMSPPVAGAGPTLRVGFCDMWADFNPAYNFFTLMLADAGRRLDPPVAVRGEPAGPDCNIVIFGPFGDSWRQLPAAQPKIHFTGENTPPVAGAALNLGFLHADMVGDNYLRFPLWILELDWFGADPAQIQNPLPIPLERATRVYAEEIPRKRKFCAFVVSNPSNPVRNAAFHWLNDYKPVDSAGRLFNNVGDAIFAGAGGGGGELKKLEFFKDYKFALTYENNAARGYTTEKYLHAKAAGCVPIYWGDEAFERDFNIAGAIDARGCRTPEELIELVRRVDEDDSEWLRRYSVPAVDSYKVAWCRRTMSECARRMFNLGGFASNSWPRFIGREPAAAAAPQPQPRETQKEVGATPAAATATVARPPDTTLELPLLVTTATRRFLSSLQQWLLSAAQQCNGTPQLEALVFLGSDVPAGTETTLREKFPFATFERLPDSAPPEGAFPDFWAPEHYGWKLWVYQELAARPALAGRMVLYTDAGSFMCRWPRDWLLLAQANGACLLEDPREENKRWCSAEFCAALGVTPQEAAAQQRLGGLVAFRAGTEKAIGLFSEAFRWAKRRDVLVGAKWAGVGADGRPFGHRHDQSILSILSLRHQIPTVDLDTVYCDKSLRKTFVGGKSLYVHRGNFQVHVPFSEGIDEAFVINLDRRKDRLERLWKNCPELEGRVERWSAVEGRNLQLTPALARLLRPNDFFWKKAVTGCALSHLGLWWKLAHEHPDIKNYLILEDDVKFCPGWETAWKNAVAEGHVPDDYDILYLGGVLPPNRAGFEEKCKQRVNDSFVRIAENGLYGQDPPNRYFHFCAYAYVLSKQGAQKVIELLRGADGYWTSADHILCNPVTVLKSYVLDPMVAGCYQDDDPAYAASEFNNFSRVDKFDSDLWNNDDRFSEEERAAALAGEVALDIGKALEDARRVATAAPAAPEPQATQKEEVIGAMPVAAAEAALEEEARTPVAVLAAAPAAAPVPAKLHGTRFLTLVEQDLDASKLYEFGWLKYLFRDPETLVFERIQPTAPPPSDCPVVVIQRPHDAAWAQILERWDSFGAAYRILHLSDEDARDDITPYYHASCRGVLRFYRRPDISSAAAGKVLTVPLGFHWTLGWGSKDSLRLTPHLPFRQTTWSFVGTNWAGRKDQLAPLEDISGHRLRYFDKWADPECLRQEEYIAGMLDSVFVPCPTGVNPETFRFYEALECGAIPLIVRTEKTAAWVDWVSEELQLLPLQNWSEAAQLIQHLLKEKPQLEQYRERVLSAWQGWKSELRGQVECWLAAGGN